MTLRFSAKTAARLLHLLPFPLSLQSVFALPHALHSKSAMASFQRFPTPYPTQDPATGHDMIDLTMSDAESETICGDGSSDCDIISISGDESDGTMAMDGDRDEVIAIMDSESDGIVSISDDEDGNNENVSGDELELEQDVSDSLIQEVELLGVPDDEEQLDEATGPDGLIVFPGDTVEFLDESFLRVVCITVKEGHVSLWGIRLLRNRQVDARWSDREGHWLCSLLRHLPNDLCAIVRIKRALPNPSLQDSIVNRPIQLVIRKRKVFFTNSMWPGFSCYSRDDPKATAMPKELKEDHGWLVCRWKYIEEVDAIRKRVSAFQMRRLEEIECDPGYGHSSKNLMTAYSEKIGLGMGAYTYGDIGAGGGGSARAAKIGGLIHKFLLDNDENACATLGLNFGKGVVAKMDLRDFSQVKGGKYKVHVLHISFPCQGHSAANRHQNPELDALRIVLGCCLSDILKVCKPRIVTIEQVQGIEKRSADGQYLRKYIQDLTEQGYQCRWKVINFGQYGNPQDRKRVVIMAAW